MINLGDEAKDVVTGFRGVVTGKAEYLSGSTEFLLQPKCTEEHLKPSACWFENTRLQLTRSGVIGVMGELIREDKSACDQ